MCVVVCVLCVWWYVCGVCGGMCVVYVCGVCGVCVCVCVVCVCGCVCVVWCGCVCVCVCACTCTLACVCTCMWGRCMCKHVLVCVHTNNFLKLPFFSLLEVLINKTEAILLCSLAVCFLLLVVGLHGQVIITMVTNILIPRQPMHWEHQ